MTRCAYCLKKFTEKDWTFHVSERCWLSAPKKPRQQPDPKWTTEPPTESGIYWACDQKSASSIKNLSSVRVIVFPLSGCVEVHEAITGELPVGYFSHWMRIDPPELPK